MWWKGYVLPEWDYDDFTVYRHRDILRRERQGVLDDRYLNYEDGRPRKLTVQTVDKLFKTSGNTTYRRTRVRNISPWMLRLAFWVTERDESERIWRTVAKSFAASIPLSIMVWFSRA